MWFQGRKLIIAAILFIFSQALFAEMRFDVTCSKTLAAFTDLTLQNLKDKSHQTIGDVTGPRLMNPKEELEKVSTWEMPRSKMPKLLQHILPSNTHIINHSLNGANEEGVVKTDSGYMNHIRGYVDFLGKKVGTNFGVNYYALLESLWNKNKKPSFVSSDAKAVMVFIHGGGTKTTGHHVAAAVTNYMNSYGVDVVSLDLPFHAEGPRTAEEARQALELVRKYIQENISPSGKDVFLTGHSLGGVFAELYRRAYPNDTLVKGVMPLSTVAEDAPGRSAEFKLKRLQRLEKLLAKTDKIAPGDRGLGEQLGRAGKTAPLCGFVCELFVEATSWVRPDDNGKSLLPAMYIIGKGDELFVGREHLYRNFVGKLENTDMVLYDRRTTFGGKPKVNAALGADGKSLIDDKTLKLVQNGSYYGPGLTAQNFHSIEDRVQARNAAVLELYQQGKVVFEEKYLSRLTDLFADDLDITGHLIFDHKPLVTYLDPTIPMDVRRKIQSASYYGYNEKGEEISDKILSGIVENLKKKFRTQYPNKSEAYYLELVDLEKTRMRKEAIETLVRNKQISYDTKMFTPDELSEVESYVRLRKFMEANLTNKSKIDKRYHRENRPIVNVLSLYINNLIFREFADNYISIIPKSHNPNFTREKGDLLVSLQKEVNQLNNLKKSRALTEEEDRQLEIKTAQYSDLKRILNSSKAKNPEDQARVDAIIAEIDQINKLTSLNTKLRELMSKSNKVPPFDPLLQERINAIAERLSKVEGANFELKPLVKGALVLHFKDIKSLSDDVKKLDKMLAPHYETINSPRIKKARAKREAVFAEVTKKDARVRELARPFLQKVKESEGRITFADMPEELIRASEEYEKASNAYQRVAASYEEFVRAELTSPNTEVMDDVPVKLAQRLKQLNIQIQFLKDELQSLENDYRKKTTRMFKLNLEKTPLLYDEVQENRFYNIKNILALTPEEYRAKEGEINSVLQSIMAQWNTLWGIRVREENESLY